MHSFSAFLNTDFQAEKLLGFIDAMDPKLMPQFKDQGRYYKVTCDSLSHDQKLKLAGHCAKTYRNCIINWD